MESEKEIRNLPCVMRREIQPWQIMIGGLGLVVMVFGGIGLWSYRDYVRYSPKAGDLVFQSLPSNPLVIAIEGATRSSYSHCGIVVRTDDGWEVLEAIGPVRRTRLFKWVHRGREGRFSVYRIKDLPSEQIKKFISSAESHIGKPYDPRYRMDDESIYCSELIWKAYLSATGKELGAPITLGELNWEPFQECIRHYEQGDPPLKRRIITPVAITRHASLEQVIP